MYDGGDAQLCVLRRAVLRHTRAGGGGLVEWPAADQGAALLDLSRDGEVMKLVRVVRERWLLRENFDRLCRCGSPDVMIRGGVCRNCGGLEMTAQDYEVVLETRR